MRAGSFTVSLLYPQQGRRCLTLPTEGLFQVSRAMLHLGTREDLDAVFRNRHAFREERRGQRALTEVSHSVSVGQDAAVVISCLVAFLCFPDFYTEQLPPLSF